MSDKFVVCTDSHLANKPPQGRIDNYNSSLIKKWQWVYDYCVEHKIKNIICPGDLCHTYRTSDELINRFVSIFASGKVTIYYVLGNHDIQGANTEFIYRTNMGLLSHYPWFQMLDVAKPYEFKNCYLTGLNYSVEKETAASFYWFEGNTDKDAQLHPDKWVILATHAMITNETMVIKGEAKSVSVHDVDTDADLLINGHYHIGHEKMVEREVLEHEFRVLNPGSMARMNLAEAEESFGPRIAVLKIDDFINCEFVDIPCKPTEEVFDVNATISNKNNKIDRERFIKSVRAMGGRDLMGDNFEQTLKQLINKPPKKLRKVLTKGVKKILRTKLEEHSG